MLGSEEEINAVEGAPLLSGLVPPPIPLGFPRGTQHSPGKGRAHRNLSLMIAIININGKTPLTRDNFKQQQKGGPAPMHPTRTCQAPAIARCVSRVTEQDRQC